MPAACEQYSLFSLSGDSGTLSGTFAAGNGASSQPPASGDADTAGSLPGAAAGVSFGSVLGDFAGDVPAEAVGEASGEALRGALSEVSGPLAGKTILFTGTLTDLPRGRAERLAEAAGADVVSGVSRKLDILVVGDSPGSKLTKAERLGVRIMTQEEFLRLVGGGGIT